MDVEIKVLDELIDRQKYFEKKVTDPIVSSILVLCSLLAKFEEEAEDEEE